MSVVVHDKARKILKLNPNANIVIIRDCQPLLLWCDDARSQEWSYRWISATSSLLT